MKSVRVEIAEPIYVPAGGPDSAESSATQVFPVLLPGDPSEVGKHFVVCAYNPPLNQEQKESVAAQLRLRGAGAACHFIVHDTEGEAVVVTDTAADGASAFEVAAAVAVVKASCGWDESNPIKVRVNDVEVLVSARFDGGQWIADSSNAD